VRPAVSVGPCAADTTPAWQRSGRRRPWPNDPAAWGYAAGSPRVGKIWRTTPPSRADTSAARCRFRGQWPRRLVAGALNLFHAAQTKSCLGHCITRGIGLRRQATIFRLRGAVLFNGAGAGIWTRVPG
jgi:hypothetical protein